MIYLFIKPLIDGIYFDLHTAFSHKIQNVTPPTCQVISLYTRFMYQLNHSNDDDNFLIIRLLKETESRRKNFDEYCLRNSYSTPIFDSVYYLEYFLYFIASC